MIKNNVTFGAKFDLAANSTQETRQFEAEGLSAQKREELSKKLDKTTPKNYKLVLTYRDRTYGKDTFALRKKSKSGAWETVAAHSTTMLSSNALNAERLKDVFAFLHAKSEMRNKEAALEKKLNDLREHNRAKLNAKAQLLNLEI